MGSLFEMVKSNRESETAERNEIAKSTQFSATEKNFVVNSTKKKSIIVPKTLKLLNPKPLIELFLIFLKLSIFLIPLQVNLIIKQWQLAPKPP